MNITPEQARFRRLPKWAQKEILGLQAEVRNLEEQVKHYELQEPTRLGQGYDARPKHAGEPKRWLHDDDHVTFYLEDGCRERDRFVQISFDRDDRIVMIRGSDAIEIHPSASNTVAVGLRR